MKTKEEIHQFYQATLMPELEKLENVRQKNKKNYSIFRIVFAILCGGLFGGMIKFFTMEIYTAAILSIVLFFIGCLLADQSDEYALDFKSKIIKKLIHFLDESLIYEPDQSISRDQLRQSELFITAASFEGEDLIRSQPGDNEFMVSEIDAKESGGQSSGRTIFHGLFYMADFNIASQIKLIILPNKAGKLFGRKIGTILETWNFMRPDSIKFDDDAFDNLFSVYVDNPIEAKRILSPGFRKNLVKLQKNTQEDIALSFQKGKVFFAVPYYKNLFEPKSSRSIEFKDIWEYIQDLYFIFNLFGDLNAGIEK